jgi:hypothetical protein
MKLTDEQIRALDHGDPICVTMDGRDCVVLRRDIYDRIRRVVEYDDSDMEPEEAYRAVLAAWDEEEDPGLEAYQDYKRR